MFRVSGRPVQPGGATTLLSCLQRCLAVVGGAAVGVIAWVAGAAASREGEYQFRLPPGALSEAVTVPAAGADLGMPDVAAAVTFPSWTGAPAPIGHAEDQPEPFRHGMAVAGLHEDARAISGTYPALWAVAFPPIVIEDEPVPERKPAKLLKRPGPPREPRSAARIEIVPEAGPARGLDVFGSVPLATSSRALRSMIDRVFAASQDWEVPADCLRSGAPGACKRHVPAAWHGLFDDVHGLEPVKAVRRVNAEVNARIVYNTDMATHGVAEHWARASETMETGAGDCEDFAILKMWLLARMGVKMQDMFVLVVRSDRLATQHAVLAVRAGGDTVILDNLARDVRSARDVGHYVPVFSANATGLWLHGFASKRQVAGLDGQAQR
jgi:predicted transglutaminase-like cysteine proteinase